MGSVEASANLVSIKNITSTSPGVLIVRGGTASFSGGQVLLGSNTGTTFTGFVAPDSLASDVYYTLPLADGTSGQFLSTNGSGVLSWATASGGSITDGDKGDITVSSSGTVWTIDNSAVTLAKIQDIATDRILGRVTAGSGSVEEITPGSGILTWLQTPSSANLASAVTDETGSGKLVFSVNPELETPYIDSIRAWVSPSTLGGRVLRFTHSSGGGNNCVEIVNAANSGTPVIRSFGFSDSNVPLRLTAKGSSPVITTATSFRVEGLTVSGVTDPGIIEARGGNQLYGGGKIYLYERSTNGNNYVGFEAPDSLASDLFWTLPATDGTVNQALVTDGGAGLSWKSFEVPLTFSTGLTRTTNTITVNTTQNIIRLSNLTTNGFIRTTNADGTLSIDTNTYLTGNQTITLSGDVTGSGATSIATTIASNAVTFDKIVQISTDTLVGRDTAGTGNVESISVAGGIEFSGSGSIHTSAFTGDVTKTAGGTSLTIANDAVTFAKIQNITSGIILGRTTASTGDVEEITPGSGVLAWLQDATSAKLATAVTDETGSGSLVFATSPTLVTPRVDLIHTATAPGNPVLGFNQVASSVNYLQMKNAASAASPVLESTGADTNVGLTISTKGSGNISLQPGGSLSVPAVATINHIIIPSAGPLWFLDSGGINYTGFKAPSTVTSTVVYTLPASDGTSGQVLRTNGSGVLSWVTQSGGVSDGNKGDITVSSSGATWTINQNAVTFNKFQTINRLRLIGRGTISGSGDAQEIQLASPLAFDSATLTFSDQNANRVFAGPVSSFGPPTFRLLNISDIPDLSSLYLTVNYTPPGEQFFGTVTSIGMTVPSFLSVTPSTITSSGTFALSLVNQNANLVFAGPASGTPQPPTFRSLVAADIPNLSSIYQPLDADLTSIAGLTGDGLIRKTSGTWGMDSNAYLTANQTITLSGDVTGSGSTSITTTIANGAVTFAKFQNITSGRLLGRTSASNGIVEEISIGTGLLLSSGVLSSTSSGGTVTSVAVTVPAFLSVSGSPITTSGTIAITIPNANANVVFAGPLSGSAAQPTFRSLVLADLPIINTNRLLGRVSVSSGIVEEITLGAGVLDWLQDPSSAKLATAVTGETGSGSLVFGTSPSFTTSATFVDNAEIRFAELAINGSNYVGFKASSSLSANTIWTLPSVDGSNGQVLVTNGTGGLSWASVSGSGITDGDKGDIVVSGSGLTWTIDNSAVTLAKIQDITDQRLLGRAAGTSGVTQELTVSSILSLSGGSLGFASQNAGLVLASPATTSGTPTFRSLVATDIPSLTSIYQPLDPDLTAIAALGADGLLRKSSGTWAMDSDTYATRQYAWFIS